MMTLIAAAALAAQPAPATNPQGQMGAMQHEQHEGMKKDCCNDCCKDMADKHSGHGSERGENAAH
jgi:hypothetical protein